jgi:protein TonB
MAMNGVQQQAKHSSTNRDDGALLVWMAVISFVMHVAAVFVLPSSVGGHVTTKRRVEMELYEPPPPPPKIEEPPKVEEPPKPIEPPKVKLKPPPVKAETPKPPPDAPPPPNDTPPDQPTKPVPIVVGITMSSTTAAGGFAVQVGNTSMGKASDKIVDPSEVKAYAAAKYAAPGSADSEPEIIGEFKVPYPEEARRSDIEGTVRLKVTLDAAGKVESVAVLAGPGYGLNEAAKEALKRFKFKPAMKGGAAVGYAYTFLLE